MPLGAQTRSPRSAQRRTLDLRRIHVRAADEDHIGIAVGDVHVAVVLDEAHVAQRLPVILCGLRGGADVTVWDRHVDPVDPASLDERRRRDASNRAMTRPSPAPASVDCPALDGREPVRDRLRRGPEQPRHKCGLDGLDPVRHRYRHPRPGAYPVRSEHRGKPLHRLDQLSPRPRWSPPPSAHAARATRWRAVGWRRRTG